MPLFAGLKVQDFSALGIFLEMLVVKKAKTRAFLSKLTG